MNNAMQLLIWCRAAVNPVAISLQLSGVRSREASQLADPSGIWLAFARVRLVMLSYDPIRTGCLSQENLTPVTRIQSMTRE